MSLSVAEEFDGFYHAHFRSTLVMTYGLTADISEAQDITQEAFCRAWNSWSRLSHFENPGAWVRRVAVNLARSRWRRMRAAAAFLARERLEHTPEMSPDHVAVVAALRKLPKSQREAMVLHYLMDMPVNEVAEHLDAPVNTVKSWLKRGRTAMADDLRLEVPPVAAPPSREVVAKANRRRRARQAAATAVILALILAGLVAVVRLVSRGGPVDPAPPSPSPTPSVTIAPITSVRWSEATIDFRVAAQGCPNGPVRFEPRERLARGPQGYPQASFDANKVVTGDLDGDGTPEAVIPLFCHHEPEAEEASESLAVVRRTADGQLQVAGILENRGLHTYYLWIADGTIFLDSAPPEWSGKKRELGRVEAWRFNGTRWEQRDTASAYPKINVLNLSIPCRGELSARPSMYSPVYAHLGRAEQPYLLLSMTCDGKPFVVVLDRVEGQWRPLDSIPGVAVQSVQGNRVKVEPPAEFTWDGRVFTQVT